MTATEYNFDGIVGPTHNYAGLAHGNLASQENRQRVSFPKRAALQGLAKMKLLADLGSPQAVLPPQERPCIPALRRLGFSGSDAEVLSRATRDAPELLAACASASSMWAANAAIISPSADTADGLLHIIPANLASHFHRSLETPTTSRVLRAIFPGPLFAHHDALPATPAFSDEGAANHSRLWSTPDSPGLEIFTYGHDPKQQQPVEHKFHPRQSLLASEAIARLHRLEPARTFFVQQHSRAIDAGVFHNDVIAVAHQNVLLYHEHAYVEGPQFIVNLQATFERTAGAKLQTVCIPEAILPLRDAVNSYLFNSQLVSLPAGGILMLAPLECREMPAAASAIAFIREHANAIREVRFVDVRESMRNGGGPACLRLRVVLTAPQQKAMHQGVILTNTLHDALAGWIGRHYREELRPEDLADPRLLEESRAALSELSKLLQLPAILPS